VLGAQDSEADKSHASQLRILRRVEVELCQVSEQLLGSQRRAPRIPLRCAAKPRRLAALNSGPCNVKTVPKACKAICTAAGPIASERSRLSWGTTICVTPSAARAERPCVPDRCRRDVETRAAYGRGAHR